MTTLASLRILLGLESGGVKTGANSVRSDLKGVQAEANRTNETLRQIGKGAGAGLGLGAGLGAFALASRGALEFAGFLTDGVKAAQEDEVSIARLTQALHENVKGWDGRTEAVDAAIKTGAQLGFTDDEIRDSLTRLTAATHNMNEAIHVQNVAMDLARFKGVDLATATAALTRIEAGRFRGLADLGIVLKTGTTQVEALAAVERVASGQAKIFGDTSAGAALEAGIAMQEAGEAVGKSLLPAFREASHFARDVLAPAITLVADNLDKIALVVGVTATAFSARFVAGLVQSAIELGKNTAAMALNAIASAGAGTAVEVFATKEALAAVAAEAVTPALAAEAVAATAVAEAVTVAAVQTELFSAVALAGAPQLELFAAGEVSAAAGATALGVAANTAATGGIAVLIRGLSAIAVRAGATGSAISTAKDLNHQFAREMAEAGFKTKSYADAVKNLNDFVGFGSITQEEANAILLKVAGTMGGVTGALNTATTSYLASERAATEAAVAYEKVADVAGTVSVAQIAVAQATIDAGHAHDALAAAQTAAAAAAEGDTGATILLAAAQAADRIATDKLKAAQDALAESLKKIPPVMLGAGNGTDTLSDKLLTLANNALIARLALEGVAPVNKSWEDRNKPGAGTTTGTPGAGTIAQLQAIQTFVDSQNKKRDQGISDSRTAVSAYADTVRDKLGKAFDDVASRAHEAFAAIHDDNLKAIDDVRDLANAALDEQERAIRGSVDAAKAQIQAMRTARTLGDLRAGVAGASTPEEQAAAQRALNDFLADQRIAVLSANADTQIAAIEAEKTKNDTVAALATIAENQRSKDAAAALDKDLAKLKEHLAAYVGNWTKAFRDIAAAAKKYHVDDLTGIKPSATPKVGTSTANPAVAGVGTTAPVINVVIHNYLDGEELTGHVNQRMAVSSSRVSSGGIATVGS